jgi:chemotaxis protein CheD
VTPVSEPDGLIEIFLAPGEFYFGDRTTRIRTLLGSCVSISLWHPRLLIGGMCHYLMPGAHPNPTEPLSGRYAEDAIALFLHEVRAAGTAPQEYVAKVFGGGRQFPKWSTASQSNLPDRNIEVGLALLHQHDIAVAATHLGGNGNRQVIFDIWSGNVWLKHNAGAGR